MPMTPTGTNLLGLVKHLAGVEFGYFGQVFGRPPAERMPRAGPDDEPNADMWATAEESRQDVIAFYRRAPAHADATIIALDLDALGHVPWWRPEARDTTLQRVLVHVTAETARHAGHADVLREGDPPVRRRGAGDVPAAGARRTVGAITTGPAGAPTARPGRTSTIGSPGHS